MSWSPMLWGSNGKLNGLGCGKLGDDMMFSRMGMVDNNINDINSHCSTIERLYAWEKKLFHDVKVFYSILKIILIFLVNGVDVIQSRVFDLNLYVFNLNWEQNAEKTKMEHEKRVEQLRRLEVKRSDYFKTEKTKKEVEKLESQIEVASQAIQTTSNEIIKLRESQLYPQLLDIVKG